MITHIGNITIVGSSHISAESMSEVSAVVDAENPDIIAIELDNSRLKSLYEKDKKGPGISVVKKIGVQGYLFTLIGGWVQKKLGSMVGVSPGSEMKLAADLAKKHKKPLALIDQPIEITLSRFSKQITWREKFRMVGDVFAGIFSKKEQKELEKRGFDLTKVPDDRLINYMMNKIKVRYPSIYRTLIHERNLVMASNIKKIQAGRPSAKILVVMGAGHIKGVMKILKAVHN